MRKLKSRSHLKRRMRLRVRIGMESYRWAVKDHGTEVNEAS